MIVSVVLVQVKKTLASIASLLVGRQMNTGSWKILVPPHFQDPPTMFETWETREAPQLSAFHYLVLVMLSTWRRESVLLLFVVCFCCCWFDGKNFDRFKLWTYTVLRIEHSNMNDCDITIFMKRLNLLSNFEIISSLFFYWHQNQGKQKIVLTKSWELSTVERYKTTTGVLHNWGLNAGLYDLLSPLYYRQLYVKCTQHAIFFSFYTTVPPSSKNWHPLSPTLDALPRQDSACSPWYLMHHWHLWGALALRSCERCPRFRIVCELGAETSLIPICTPPTVLMPHLLSNVPVQ